MKGRTISVPAHGVERVVVVGGGAMGSASAWRLALRGYRVTLLEQFWPGHVRGASRGSSRIFRLAYPDHRYVDLIIARRAGWTPIALWRPCNPRRSRPEPTYGTRLRCAHYSCRHPQRRVGAALENRTGR